MPIDLHTAIVRRYSQVDFGSLAGIAYAGLGKRSPISIRSRGATIMPQYMVERHLPGITPEQLIPAFGRADS
jgi:hypothetical protein